MTKETTTGPDITLERFDSRVDALIEDRKWIIGNEAFLDNGRVVREMLRDTPALQLLTEFTQTEKFLQGRLEFLEKHKIKLDGFSDTVKVVELLNAVERYKQIGNFLIVSVFRARKADRERLDAAIALADTRRAAREV